MQKKQLGVSEDRGTLFWGGPFKGLLFSLGYESPFKGILFSLGV